MPCVHSKSISSATLCLARVAWAAATCGQSTTSPRRPGIPSSSAPPCSAGAPPGCGGRSSSIGNASTSVGPSSPIQRTCSSVMAGSSTSSTDNSASGCTRMSSRTCRASPASRPSSTSMPDSLAISMLIWPPSVAGRLDSPAAVPVPARPACRQPTGLRGQPGVISLVGVDDVSHQLVPHHVVAGQPAEVDVLHAFEDLLHLPQPAGLPGRQVDLGHVPRDDDPGAEAEPGQEHFHLLGRGVLRLVQDDERV